MLKETSDCGSRRIGRGGMIIYEDCKGGAARWFLDRTDGQTAFTVGDTVFTTDEALDRFTELEEYYHFLQYQREKDGMLPAYFTKGIWYGYDSNPYEDEAKRYACRDYAAMYGRDDRWARNCEGRSAPPDGLIDEFWLYNVEPWTAFPEVQVDRARRTGEKIRELLAGLLD